MPLLLDDVVSYDTSGRRRPILRRRPRSAGSASRRDFLRGAGAVGVFVGLSVVGFLPPARRARADHPDDDIAGGCQGASYAENDDCLGCNTDETMACCCASSGWHRHDGTTYFLRPDQCDPNNFDGWKWFHGSCCCLVGRKDQTWRCHDGKKMVNGSPVNSICKQLLSSGSCVKCI